MTTQQWLAAGFGFLFVSVLLATALWLVFGRRREVPKPAMYILRTVLALAAGAFGVVIPGMLDVSLDAPGLVIRGAAGLALVVLVYKVNPPELIDSSVHEQGKTKDSVDASMHQHVGPTATGVQIRGNGANVDLD